MKITTMLLKASDKSILVFYKVSHFIILIVNVCVVYIFLVIWSVIPSLLSSTHPHTLFTCLYSHLHIFWSRHSVITLHLISFLPLSYTYHDYHPSPLSPHITQTQCISTHPPSYKYHDHLTFTSWLTVERIHPKAPVMLIFIVIFTCLPSCINLSNIQYLHNKII